MLADAMPEIEEDDQTPPGDDLRRRPIPVNTPSIDLGITANGTQQARAIPLGSTADLESRVRPAVTRAVPAGRAISVGTSSEPAVAPNARAIPITPAATAGTAIPITPGSSEDLESRVSAGSPMMRAGIRGTPIPVVPGKGSTEDLENKSLQTFEHPKSAPIQTGVASLWTKAENISRVAKEGTGPTGNGSVKELLGRGGAARIGSVSRREK
jgi:hypothetical protein